MMKYKNKATNDTWLHVGKVVRMWGEDEDGNSCLPSGDPLLVPYKHMCLDLEMNSDVTNMEKEVFKASQANNQRVFILENIEKYIEVWEVGMIRNDSYVLANDMIRGLLEDHFGGIARIHSYSAH